MDVLATRVLSYPDESGNERELILTVFRPFKATEYEWRCEFVFGQPIEHEMEYGASIDFIKALLNGLTVARGYLECTELFGRAHWQGMLDCGLPDFAEEPASLGPEDIPPPFQVEGNMDVLATQAVGYWDGNGVEIRLLLTLFVPFKADSEVWKCGFTFDPPPGVTIRYGVGADFIEAFLDGLAKARATFEGTAPKGWTPSEAIADCASFPYKVGRSFWRDPVGDPPPDTPHVSAG